MVTGGYVYFGAQTSDDNRTLASVTFLAEMQGLEEEVTETACPTAANNCGDSTTTTHSTLRGGSFPRTAADHSQCLPTYLKVGELCKSMTQAQKTFKEQNNNPDVC